MPSDERDRQFERALQRHLRGGAPDEACPDAETLAAYHERTLSLEEMARWKQHIGGCVRCQETLALVEETSSVELPEWEEATRSQGTQAFGNLAKMPAAPRQMQKEEMAGAATAVAERVAARSSWKWIGPLGALAAGLLIFVVARESTVKLSSKQTATQVAENRETAAPMSKSQEPRDLTRQELEAAKSDAPVQAQGPARQEKQVTPRMAPPYPKESRVDGARVGGNEADTLSKDEGKLYAEKRTQPLSALETGAQEQARADRDAESERSAMPAPPAVAVHKPPSPAKPMAPSAGAVAGMAKKEAGLEDKNAKAAGTVTETVMVQNETSEVVAAKTSSHGNFLREMVANDPRIVMAPDEKHAWRVGEGGRIEATSDGGRNWKQQMSGMGSDLTGGSAPAQKVCWIVGKAGTILLTVDGGKHWVLTGSPLQEDLGGVQAQDAKHARVWSLSNNKRFQTVDGGVTWTPAANE